MNIKEHPFESAFFTLHPPNIQLIHVKIMTRRKPDKSHSSRSKNKHEKRHKNKYSGVDRYC
jgi:hypothetical protein